MLDSEVSISCNVHELSPSKTPRSTQKHKILGNGDKLFKETSLQPIRDVSYQGRYEQGQMVQGKGRPDYYLNFKDIIYLFRNYI